MRLIECIPNFSEGRNRDIIDAITGEIEATEKAVLLDVDPGEATNRTVVTFVGPPEAVEKAAFRAISKAAQLIDMRQHNGEHARMGATDVCPFVPISGVTVEECVELARKLGKRVADELGIPVYLYEKAAANADRCNLADIRKGEYEGLEKKLADPDWKPDFGVPAFNVRSGATVIGVREFLIAYNVNLNTRNKKLAKEIALNIREKGRFKRDADRKKIRGPDDTFLRQVGTLKAVKATGWYIEEYGIAQVSINLVDTTVTSIHQAFDECCRQAESLGVRVTGSEIVGLVPLSAMVAAGRHYLEKQGECSGVSERELIAITVLSLGLNDLYRFEPDQKVIEFRVREPLPLGSLELPAFLDELASSSPAPGGGSAAALAGSTAGALVSMVANLAFSTRKLVAKRELNDTVAVAAQNLKDRLLLKVDEDAASFNAVLAARRMKKKTEAQKIARAAAVATAVRRATELPLSVMELAQEVAELAVSAMEICNPSSATDAGCAGHMAVSAAQCAYLNVLVNLNDIEDKALALKVKERAEEHLKATIEANGNLQIKVKADMG
ncbi:MAG: glutamate formimidoyltransferase [bacterium]|nr:glutamate formimidoyltransferase [bacterium]